MNDRWMRGEARWNKAHKVRVARLFRSYVRTPSKPNAPIVREACHFHPHVLAEFHHIDYRKPFKGAWLCGWSGMSCHRKVDHGALELPPEAIRDYTEVVRDRFRPSMRGARNPMHASKRAAKVELEEAPF